MLIQAKLEIPVANSPWIQWNSEILGHDKCEIICIRIEAFLAPGHNSHLASVFPRLKRIGCLQIPAQSHCFSWTSGLGVIIDGAMFCSAVHETETRPYEKCNEICCKIYAYTNQSITLNLDCHLSLLSVVCWTHCGWVGAIMWCR